jgi:Cupin domain
MCGVRTKHEPHYSKPAVSWADVAERRSLIMVNPAPGNTCATTRNLVAAYQMIQPGETARSHRHTPAALRLVLDVGDDVYTVVDGKRVDMTPGDVVLTPSWCWHGHARHMRRDICRQISQLGDPRSHRPCGRSASRRTDWGTPDRRFGIGINYSAGFFQLGAKILRAYHLVAPRRTSNRVHRDGVGSAKGT